MPIIHCHDTSSGTALLRFKEVTFLTRIILLSLRYEKMETGVMKGNLPPVYANNVDDPIILKSFKEDTKLVELSS